MMEVTIKNVVGIMLRKTTSTEIKEQKLIYCMNYMIRGHLFCF